jgi:hypothetical protein
MAKKDKKATKTDAGKKSASGSKSGGKADSKKKGAGSKAKGSSAKTKKGKKSDAKATNKAKNKPGKNPREISTGKGKSVAELASALMDHLRSGKPDTELWAAHFAPKFMSIEGIGQGWKGVKAVKKKCDEWMAQHTIHSVNFEGPYVGATGFVVKFFMDITNNASGQRIAMTEVGVYTVEKGKVVQEEFMYFCDPAAAAPAQEQSPATA